MTLSPRTLISIGAALTLAVCTLALALALQIPLTGMQFAAHAERSDALVVRSSSAATDAQPALSANDVIVAFIAAGERLPANSNLLVEDPDAIATFADYNVFMAQQQLLAQALAAGQLVLEREDGTRLPLQQQQRSISDLPLMFWLQLLFGVGGMLTGMLVMAGRPLDTATRLYALTGFGFLIFAPAAAVYSTRELILDGEIFRVLSLANHFGALLFTASLTALLWSYPVRLRGLPVVAICYLAALAAWVGDILQLGDENTLSPITVLLIFAFSFVFAAIQWWQTRHAPAERAALRWFLLSIYIATGLFAGVILIPTAIGVPPPASQGVMFGAFLIMYWGLALGIVRYRLFRLAQWWQAIWWWFLGGLAVVLVDVLLISSLALSDALALSIAVAVVGWLYFPLRQWLWARVGARSERKLAQWLPDVLPILIETQAGTSSEGNIRERWPGALNAVFRPLANEAQPGMLEKAEIRDNGLALAVPDVRDGASHLVLRHANRGERLFTSADIDTLVSLRELFDLALDRLRSRDAGARVERERIRRDIHDDLGAKLLTLLHTTPESGQPIVREALEDLRTLLRALEHDNATLRDSLDSWQAEARKRSEAASATLRWQSSEVPAALALNARQHANLTRVLREAVSNALRHARPATLLINVKVAGNALLIDVGNDGAVLPLAEWSTGRGRQIMQSRINELGGTLNWQIEDGYCHLLVSVPVN